MNILNRFLPSVKGTDCATCKTVYNLQRSMNTVLYMSYRFLTELGMLITRNSEASDVRKFHFACAATWLRCSQNFCPQISGVSVRTTYNF